MSDKPCPKCGHCPACGRSNAPVYPWGLYPYQPYRPAPYTVSPYPYTYWSNSTSPQPIGATYSNQLSNAI